jgi:hypothetical protein
MSQTKIVSCTCKHEYQDKTYGPYKRVANAKKTGKDSKPEYVCTVCTRTHS